jgi:hypothetical protein
MVMTGYKCASSSHSSCIRTLLKEHWHKMHAYNYNQCDVHNFCTYKPDANQIRLNPYLQIHGVSLLTDIKNKVAQ